MKCMYTYIEKYLHKNVFIKITFVVKEKINNFCVYYELINSDKNPFFRCYIMLCSVH